jgi:hypothetical protein
LLLENTTYMGVRGINREGEDCVRSWMAKRNGGDQGSLGGDESGLGCRRPQQHFG